MPIKSAEAVWNGTLTEGSGHLTTQSKKLDVDFGWKSRAGDEPGTNPEELIAAAHAGCFSMAFSHILTGAGFPPTQIKTSAKVSFEKIGDGFGITTIALSTVAKIEKIDDGTFQELATMAKENCPVSKALAATKITLEAKLG
ncbi:MAG TPA: OsmC family protein [Tepidisphaeraceae bacterium]|nr:OsmC family protein [Tepidisphaeraceae bacterium]